MLRPPLAQVRLAQRADRTVVLSLQRGVVGRRGPLRSVHPKPHSRGRCRMAHQKWPWCLRAPVPSRRISRLLLPRRHQSPLRAARPLDRRAPTHLIRACFRSWRPSLQHRGRRLVPGHPTHHRTSSLLLIHGLFRAFSSRKRGNICALSEPICQPAGARWKKDGRTAILGGSVDQGAHHRQVCTPFLQEDREETWGTG